MSNAVLGGSSIAAQVMAALPIGLPKLRRPGRGWLACAIARAGTSRTGASVDGFANSAYVIREITDTRRA